MDVAAANACISRTMDAIIRKEKVSQMLDKEHNKDAGKSHESRWDQERRRRYEYIQKFRDGGGRFDLHNIVNPKISRPGLLAI